MVRILLIVYAVLCLYGCSDNPADRLIPKVKVFGEPGITDGAFSAPRAVEVDSEGNLYIIDKTGRIQIFDRSFSFIRTLTLPDSEKGTPTGFCVSPDNRLYIADTHYSRILVFDPEGGVVRMFGTYGDEKGAMIYPTDVAVDRDGNIYVAEYGKNDRIIKFSSDCEFLKEWGGTGTAEGEFQRPMAVEIDTHDRLLVCDSCNHRVQMFDLDGNFLGTFGSVGHNMGDLKYPYDIVSQPDGTMFVCEYGNCRIQMFTKDGEPLSVLGSPGREPGMLHSPWGVALLDPLHIVVADTGNNRMQVFPVSEQEVPYQIQSLHVNINQ